VRQYPNAVANLIGSFRTATSSPPATPSDKKEATKKASRENDQRAQRAPIPSPLAPEGKGQGGLRGEYFKSFGFRTRNRVLERIDPTVQFDFGENAPDSKNFEPDRFSIRWEGAILAPET